MFTFNRSLDLDAEGLSMFLLPYQRDALTHLYTVGEANSRALWLYVNRDGAPDPKSRASVINFLNALVAEDLIAYKENTGKGGYHRVYMPHPDYLTVNMFKRELVRRLLKKIALEFNDVLILGEETRRFIVDGEPNRLQREEP